MLQRRWVGSGLSFLRVFKLVDEVFEWCEVFVFDQFEFQHEKYEVFEAGVEVGFGADRTHFVEVTEHTSGEQQRSAHALRRGEAGGERRLNTCSRCVRIVGRGVCRCL
jgi:hypothetical protein